MIVFSTLLHADYPAFNRRRAYYIEAGSDLFEQWFVEIHYGRIGCKGKHKVFLVESEQAAKKQVKIRLRKRQRLVKKTGMGYAVIRTVGEDWLE